MKGSRSTPLLSWMNPLSPAATPWANASPGATRSMARPTRRSGRSTRARVFTAGEGLAMEKFIISMRLRRRRGRGRRPGLRRASTRGIEPHAQQPHRVQEHEDVGSEMNDRRFDRADQLEQRGGDAEDVHYTD